VRGDDVTTPSEHLDRFQVQVLTALADGGSPAEVMAALQVAAPDEDVLGWVNSWDPDLVALAGELVRTWGHRSSPDESRARSPGRR
jgi:hypothetical protein